MEYFLSYMLLKPNKICEDKDCQNTAKHIGENKSCFSKKWTTTYWEKG